MILKLLLVAAVIYVVYIMFFKKRSIKSSQQQKSEKKETPKANDMIECAQCGVYVEVSECILSNGKYFCSRECIEAYK
jgi:uncharacterized protein